MTLTLSMKAGAWEEALTLLSEMYLSCKTSKSRGWKLLSEVCLATARCFCPGPSSAYNQTLFVATAPSQRASAVEDGM